MVAKNLLIIIGFKIVWLSCVFGELYSNSLLGFFTGIIFLTIFLIFKIKKIDIIKKILFFSAIGYIFDSFLSYFGLYKIDAQINFLFLPLWFLVLWPSFCCLFADALTFLKNKLSFAIILGAFFGPLSYYAGLSTGLANISSMLVFLLISLFWSLIMLTYSKFF